MSDLEELNRRKAELEAKILEAKKRERVKALKKVKERCKEFSFTAGRLKGSLAEGRRSEFL